MPTYVFFLEIICIYWAEYNGEEWRTHAVVSLFALSRDQQELFAKKFEPVYIYKIDVAGGWEQSLQKSALELRNKLQ